MFFYVRINFSMRGKFKNFTGYFSACLKVTFLIACFTFGIAIGTCLTHLHPNPIRTTAASGIEAISPHTLVFIPAFFALSTVIFISFNMAG